MAQMGHLCRFAVKRWQRIAVPGLGSVSVSFMTPDPYVGAELTDGPLQDEIELVGDLVVAASASEGPLSEAEIDEVLGLSETHHVAPEHKRRAGKHAWHGQDA